jgi:hypothetical protein
LSNKTRSSYISFNLVTFSGKQLGRSALNMSPALRAELDAAVDAYLRECERLIESHMREELSAEWDADPHGEHCRFENLRTGHIVEAPFPDEPTQFAIDPYFFGVFVKTGPDFPLLKQAIKHEFHDSLALLDGRAQKEKDA